MQLKARQNKNVLSWRLKQSCKWRMFSGRAFSACGNACEQQRCKMANV